MLRSGDEVFTMRLLSLSATDAEIDAARSLRFNIDPTRRAIIPSLVILGRG